MRSLLILLAMTAPALAQPKGFNYDESKVPDFELPDPLVMQDGTPVTTAEQWQTKRRPEVVELFEEHVYGRVPTGKVETTVDADVAFDALDGTVERHLVTLTLTGNGKQQEIDLLVYLPKDAPRPVPVFLGLNFRGNHTIHADPAIPIPRGWVPNDNGAKDHRATEAGRGVRASRWPVEVILKRGFGLATIYCGDIDPDFDDDFQNGVHPLLHAKDEKPGSGEWGSIAAWAWGLSRALDYLETVDAVDAKRVAVIGHSRLGKTALWAGARDERFAMVVSNNSGCGGAALSRRAFGETVKRINTSFPHWFCDNFQNYNDDESACPVDQHELVALVAPRPCYIASATGDQWADPRGEFLSGKHASPVYELLGVNGIVAAEQPAPDTPVQQGHVGYHLRTGKHDITEYDWQRYIDFFEKRVPRN